MRRLSRLLALPLAVVLAGCPFDNFGDDQERACDLLLTNITLAVVDAGGAPVRPTSATVERADGTSLVCAASGNRPSTGCVDPLSQSQTERPIIVVVDDNVTVSTAVEMIRVGASAGALRGTAEIFVRRGECHVEKVSGPTEIVLR